MISEKNESNNNKTDTRTHTHTYTHTHTHKHTHTHLRAHTQSSVKFWQLICFLKKDSCAVIEIWDATTLICLVVYNKISVIYYSDIKKGMKYLLNIINIKLFFKWKSLIQNLPVQEQLFSSINYNVYVPLS